MASNEQRKLIKFGNSSYIIALPKSWITKNKLKKGEVLFLEETSNNELIITTKANKIKEFKSITLNLNDKEETTFARELNAAYVDNYNEIVILGKNLLKKGNFISNIVQNKVGFEISEQDNDKIIIKDILDFEAISSDKVIRRLDNIIRSMFEDLKEGISYGKFKEWTMKEIYDADNSVNKFYFLSMKMIRKCHEDPKILQKLKMNSRSVSDMQWITLHLEYMGDELKRLASILHERGILNQKELTIAVNTIEEEYISMMNSFYNKDIKVSRELAMKKKSMMGLYEKLFFSKSKEVVRGTESIVEKLKSITGYVHNISRVIGY